VSLIKRFPLFLFFPPPPSPHAIEQFVEDGIGKSSGESSMTVSNVSPFFFFFFFPFFLPSPSPRPPLQRV